MSKKDYVQGLDADVSVSLQRAIFSWITSWLEFLLKNGKVLSNPKDYGSDITYKDRENFSKNKQRFLPHGFTIYFILTLKIVLLNCIKNISMIEQFALYLRKIEIVSWKRWFECTIKQLS